MKATRSLFKSTLTRFIPLLACAALGVSALAADDADATVARLKESKHTLAAGIAQSEKENGPAISAKFEVEDGKLWLSVYTAKDGLGKDAEHNTLLELKGDATEAAWKPATEVFEDKKHLTRAAMQLSIVQLTKLSLTEIIAAAEKAQPGTVYSVIPSIKNEQPVFTVKVVTAQGKSAELALDAKTGKVAK